MQKKFAFATIAVAGLATAASAQTRLSQNLEEILVTAGAGVACATTAAPQTTAVNNTARTFTLTDFGITEGFTVNTVEFGIENMTLPTLGPDSVITVNLYQVPAGSPPITEVQGAMPVGSAEVTIADGTALIVETIDVDGFVEAGSALMVEVVAENFSVIAGTPTGDVFFIGGNSFGETGPSYLLFCDGIDFVDIDDFGFTDSHFIVIAEGEEGGGTACRVDIDGDMALTIFDFLAFQNLFDAGDLAADFDGDGSLTIFDFLTFQNEFDAGCTF